MSLFKPFTPQMEKSLAFASAATVPSAQVVGKAFVERYYSMLHRSPETVNGFYNSDSVLSRPDSDGTMTSVTSLTNIRMKMESFFDYKNCKIEIETADAQNSYQAGVIVVVTGCLTGADNVRRTFMQTFFLAPQKRGYFVLNDVFRFIKEESEPPKITSVSSNGAADNVTVTVPSTSDPEPVLASDHSVFDSINAPETEETQNDPEICDPSDNKHGEATQIVRPNSSATHEKKSYASMVSKSATSTAPKHVTTHGGASAVNANQQGRNSEKTPVEPHTPTPEVPSGLEINNIRKQGYSIFIRNLALNATALQLEEEFKRFGPIKPGGVHVRSGKQGPCFGFVEFQSLESMKNAIKASPVNLAGRQALVEEKRSNPRVGSCGRGSYTSRSGGFRSDSSGGSRGYGRN